MVFTGVFNPFWGRVVFVFHTGSKPTTRRIEISMNINKSQPFRCGFSPCKIFGWWSGTCSYLFHILGIIIPTDFHIFQRGWNHQPDMVLTHTYIIALGHWRYSDGDRSNNGCHQLRHRSASASQWTAARFATATQFCHPASSRVIRTDGIGAAGCPQCQPQCGMGPSSRHDPIDFGSNQAPEART